MPPQRRVSALYATWVSYDARLLPPTSGFITGKPHPPLPLPPRQPTSDGSESRGAPDRRPEAFIISFPLQAFLLAICQSLVRVGPTVMKLRGNCGHTHLNARLERVPHRKYASKRYPRGIHSRISQPQQRATSEASSPLRIPRDIHTWHLFLSLARSCPFRNIRP